MHVKRKNAIISESSQTCVHGAGGNCDEDFSTFNSLTHQGKERAGVRRKLNYRGIFSSFLCPLPRELLQAYAITQLHGHHNQLKPPHRIDNKLLWLKF